MSAELAALRRAVVLPVVELDREALVDSTEGLRRGRDGRHVMAMERTV